MTFGWRSALTVALALSYAGSPAAHQVPEPDLKAAFLFNFTRFVAWPPAAIPDTEPFRVCVIAGDVMIKAIERTLSGETVSGRPVQTINSPKPEQAAGCHIIFVGADAADRAAPLVSSVSALPVLTVGDGQQFRDRGTMIQFVVEQGRVRFDVDLKRASAAGLNINSRMLRVARDVRTTP